MTSKPTFTSSISLGNWITIGAIVATMAVGWGVMQEQNTANRLSVAEIDADLAAIRIRVGKLETEDARSQERYSALLNLLNRIDGRLARIERGNP